MILTSPRFLRGGSTSTMIPGTRAPEEPDRALGPLTAAASAAPVTHMASMLPSKHSRTSRGSRQDRGKPGSGGFSARETHFRPVFPISHW